MSKSSTASSPSPHAKLDSQEYHQAGQQPNPYHTDERHGSFAHGHSIEYRTYKRRWFGLVQLSLMNIVVSWDWLTYAPVANASAEYYGVSLEVINWLSISFFLAFVVVFPLAIAIIHRGPKPAFLVAAFLMLVGNWVRYAGSTKPEGGRIALAMAGEILIGFSQPFILAAPTRYSDIWFTHRGRVAATAVASLANPLGGALGQLVNPLLVKKAGDISNLVLYVAIVSTVCCVPALFVPGNPPIPAGPSSQMPKLGLGKSIRAVTGSLEIWLILIPFFIFVGFFNSLSSLLNQFMVPYGFSVDEAGIAGAILIFVGLFFAAISSPILDRTKAFIPAQKCLIPIIALCYLVFIWMPETRTVIGPYVVLAVLGAASFANVPIALELLIELSHPLSPEVTSTIAWAGGQLFGAIFVIISAPLTAGPDGDPPMNMKKNLVFQGVLAMVICPLPLFLGLFGRKDKVLLRRIGNTPTAFAP
ncbi:hypothetical protein G6O67_008234 [Ophiocordyceps sinensis]|uniref:Major Facilitator Superfamily protein n=4 Tax=Ophiocordyceps sinensis TaxID=72228 RepID=A0A8H4LT31_9HYPO|nr:Major Facilitator Superfamily protein [Ophiocordyceps sinensis CO18]KAF4504830.1 hypothetical protein G6O67_008234 [Ophiocordyceps sinensis]